MKRAVQYEAYSRSLERKVDEARVQVQLATAEVTAREKTIGALRTQCTELAYALEVAQSRIWQPEGGGPLLKYTGSRSSSSSLFSTPAAPATLDVGKGPMDAEESDASIANAVRRAWSDAAEKMHGSAGEWLHSLIKELAGLRAENVVLRLNQTTANRGDGDIRVEDVHDASAVPRVLRLRIEPQPINQQSIDPSINDD